MTTAQQSSYEPGPVRPCTLVHLDLCAAGELLKGRNDAAVAAILDVFYTRAHAALEAEGGQVIKHLGDAVVGVFESDEAVSKAVRAVRALEAALRTDPFPSAQALRGAIHVGQAVIGSFGPCDFPDVVGRDVQVLMRLGGGRGLTLSEKAYRRLPSEERTPFDKHGGQTVYRG